MALWSLREQPPRTTRLMLEVVGGILFVVVWWLIAIVWEFPRSVLPTPLDVVKTFPVLFLGRDETISLMDALINNVLWHAGHSIYLNALSYVEAIMLAVPLGFLIGLFGPFRAMTEREMTGFRYLPITAFISVIINWFGISTMAKVQFLTLGVIVYLLPTVIQRIDDVEQVYVDTAKTCGATRWQRIKSVFFPLVAGRLSDDCKNLVPITWTYVIIAEGFNLGEGGLGALAVSYGRASRFDFVFALVVIILTIGFLQDKIWTAGDKKIFPWKYA